MEVPDPHPEAEVLLGQRPHRTNIDRIASVLVVDRFARPMIDLVVIATAENRQLAGAGNFIEEPRTACAQDAALLVQHHIRADIDRLALLILLAELKARRLSVVIHVVVLQLALAGLIAHRTIDRMIDEQKFQYRFLCSLAAIAGGVHHHSLRSTRVARDLQLGRFFHVDQAHSAVARNRQPRMVAIVRNFNSRVICRLDQVQSVCDLDFLAVDGELRHLIFS